MSNKIITISREFGSGGRTIGKEVAAKLGIPCYDSELLEKIAEESGFAKEYIAEQGEYAVGRHWLCPAETTTAIPIRMTYGPCSRSLFVNWPKKAPASSSAAVPIIS